MTIHEDNITTKARRFRKTENIDRQQDENGYYCCAEWHLRQLSPVCAYIYPLAYRLTSDWNQPDGRSRTKLFFGSAERLAAFFRYSPPQIRRGLKELAKLGFLELVDSKKFRPNSYRVLSHVDWVKGHPGLCTEKVEITHTAHGDPLGQGLWSASGGLLKIEPHLILNIRKLGLSEENILSAFADYLNKQPQPGGHKKTLLDFYIKLKKGAGHGEQERAA